MIYVLFAGAILTGACFIIYMMRHLHDPLTELQIEVATIRCEAARGWSHRRIRRHHRKFCLCQIRYLCDGVDLVR